MNLWREILIRLCPELFILTMGSMILNSSDSQNTSKRLIEKSRKFRKIKTGFWNKEPEKQKYRKLNKRGRRISKSMMRIYIMRVMGLITKRMMNLKFLKICGLLNQEKIQTGEMVLWYVILFKKSVIWFNQDRTKVTRLIQTHLTRSLIKRKEHLLFKGISIDLYWFIKGSSISEHSDCSHQ